MNLKSKKFKIGTAQYHYPNMQEAHSSRQLKYVLILGFLHFGTVILGTPNLRFFGLHCLVIIISLSQWQADALRLFINFKIISACHLDREIIITRQWDSHLVDTSGYFANLSQSHQLGTIKNGQKWQCWSKLGLLFELLTTWSPPPHLLVQRNYVWLNMKTYFGESTSFHCKCKISKKRFAQ